MAADRSFLIVTLFCVTVIHFNTFVGAEFGDCPNPVNLSYPQHQFNLYFLVPFEPQYYFCRARVEPAIVMALGNGSSNIVPHFEDSQCDADYVPNVASDIQNEALLYQNCSATQNASTGINIFIGPTCDYASGRVASLSNHWDWPIFLTGSRTANFDKKKGLPCCATITRPGITATDSGIFFGRLFEYYKWTNSVVVYSTYNNHGAHVSYQYPSDCSTMLSSVTTSFRNHNWTRYQYYDITYRSYDVEIENDTDRILNDISKMARVSIWCVGKPTMRRVMLKAREKGMTEGEYAFIFLDYYNTNQNEQWSELEDGPFSVTVSDLTLLGDPYDKLQLNDTATIEALRALQVVRLQTPSSQEYKEFSDLVKAELTKNPSGPQEEMDYVNPFITHYYDTVMLLKAAINHALCYNPASVQNGRQFTESMWNISMTSLGRNLTMEAEGDRSLDYSLLDMNPTTHEYEVVLNYFGNTRNFQKVKEVDWPGSVVPKNVPDCGYEKELCPKTGPDTLLLSILLPVSAVLLLAGLCIFFLLRKVQHERYLRKMSWKVNWGDIEFRHTREKSSVGGGSKQDTHSCTSSTGGSMHALGISGRRLFAKAGLLKGNVVAVKELNRRKVSLDSALLIELEKMYEMDHEHICKFMGANEESPNVCILTEYCSRGSLNDVLEDSQYEIEDVFKNSFISDIVAGMLYLHRSFFQLHGNLKSSNCLVDSRFVVKLTDFGLEKFREGTRTDSRTGHKYLENKLWTAPELLRSHVLQGTQKGDVYSFAIVAQEILYRRGVFYRHDNLTVQEILHHVTSPTSGESPMRPTLEDNDDVVVDPELRKLIRKCWGEYQNERPTFHEISRDVRKLHRKKNLVDSLLERLENYSMHLEEKVEERTEQFKAEKERADTLLYQMLPKQVAERLKQGTNVLPTSFEKVTIFFSDIVGFTAISHGSTPLQVVDMLNDLYTKFDTIIDRFDVYKVETIGDAYMVVSGLPNKNGNLHAREIARMSLSLINCVRYDFKIKHMPETQLKLRVGIHTGPVVAGVVGLKMPRYCLFGDTVNTASRMESNGKPLTIHVSPKTKDILDEFGTFNLEERDEEVFLKGLGNWKTWWLLGENESSDDVSEDILESQMQHGNEDHNTITFITNETLGNHSGDPKVGGGKRRGTDASRERRSGVLGSVIHAATDERMTKEAIIQEHVRFTVEKPKSPDGEDKRKRIVQFSGSCNNLNVAVDLKGAEAHGRDSGIGMTFDNDGYREEPNEQSDML